MTEQPVPCIVYGVKSSPDEKESVADQHKQVLAAIEREGGRMLVCEPFGEANASGYRKERGAAMEAAMQTAIEAAAEHGEAELWVFHSSRLARGDGRKGKRSIQLVVAQLLYEDVVVRSVADPEMVTPMLVGIASKVSNQYSKDLSSHVKRGLRRRREAGKPVGGVPFGYTVERQVVDGVMVSRRVIDSEQGPIVIWIYEQIAASRTPGDVARDLIARGVPAKRGTWRTDSITGIIDNDDYEGEHGYPAIIDPDLAQRARAARRRMDPVAVQCRRGGHPADDDYVLRGIGFCTRCGAPLYTTRKWTAGQSRAYLCRERVKASGLCSAPPIPAELVEIHVLNHVETFIGSLEAWIADRLRARSADEDAQLRAIDARRDQLAELDTRRAARSSELASVGFHPIALEILEQMDQEREALRSDIADADAMLAEWDGSNDIDEMVEFYNALVDQVRGLMAKGKESAELSAALRTVLAGLWMEVEPERERVLIEFSLRVEPEIAPPRSSIPLFSMLRDSLPPVRFGYQPIEPQTFGLTQVSS